LVREQNRERGGIYLSISGEINCQYSNQQHKTASPTVRPAWARNMR
jgi:hypothetical protein